MFLAYLPWGIEYCETDFRLNGPRTIRSFKYSVRKSAPLSFRCYAFTSGIKHGVHPSNVSRRNIIQASGMAEVYVTNSNDSPLCAVREIDPCMFYRFYPAVFTQEDGE